MHAVCSSKVRGLFILDVCLQSSFAFLMGRGVLESFLPPVFKAAAQKGRDCSTELTRTQLGRLIEEIGRAHV